MTRLSGTELPTWTMAAEEFEARRLTGRMLWWREKHGHWPTQCDLAWAMGVSFGTVYRRCQQAYRLGLLRRMFVRTGRLPGYGPGYRYSPAP